MATAANIKLKELGQRIWPNQPPSKYRNFYEPSDPTTQCNNILGKFKSGTLCYICAMPIIEGKGIIRDGLNQDCEHLLPVAQAVLFLGLYGNKFKEGQLFYNPSILPLEYKWAHKTCNQIKLDKIFIKFIPNNPVGEKFIVDIDSLEGLLIDIWDNMRSDSANFNKMLHDTYITEDNFVYARLSNQNNTMNSEGALEKITVPFQNIANYLNSFDAPEVLLLISAAKALEGPMSEEGATLVSGVDEEALKLEAISNLKVKVINEYDLIVKQTVKELEKIFSTNPIIYTVFLEEAEKYKAFYTALYVKLPTNLQYYWKEYIKAKLYTLFYNINVSKIETLMAAKSIATGNSVINSSFVKTRHLSILAHKITVMVNNPTYKKLQAEEDRITNSNNSTNFEGAASAAMNRGNFPSKKAVKRKVSAPSKRASPKGQVTSIRRPRNNSYFTKKNKQARNTLIAIKRDRTSDINVPHTGVTEEDIRARNALITLKENKINNLNMNNSIGGRRKTRKNRRN